MTDHAHILLKSGPNGLATSMRFPDWVRAYYNRRHKRAAMNAYVNSLSE
jgi:hypothetical protein